MIVKHKQRQGLPFYMGLFIALCLASQSAAAFDGSVFLQSVAQFSTIAEDISIIMGIGFILSALLKFKRYGEMRTQMSSQMTISKPMFFLLAGVCLLLFPTTLETLLVSIWGEQNSMIAYTPTGSTDQNQMIAGVIAFVRLSGIFGVIRGFALLTRAGGEQGQPGTMGKALLHIIGGLMCVNIVAVMYLIEAVFGFSVV